jgi:hypothetical protein
MNSWCCAPFALRPRAGESRGSRESRERSAQTFTMASEQELRTVLSPLLSREEQAIWITKNSCVRLYGDSTAEDRRKRQFRLNVSDKIERHELSIHASTLKEAIICLDFLVGLKDTHFKEMWLTLKDGGALRRPRLCPFGVDILEKILQTSARRIRFSQMIFTPEHCRILASSGTQTNIEFVGCIFQDEGASFVESFAARQDVTSGPVKLRLSGCLPFNDRNWALFLSQLKLESLELCFLHFHNEVSCRAVALAKVQCLTFESSMLGDGGAALVEAVREGRGPKELCFRGNPFDSSERLVTFMNALRGNDHLERLELPRIDVLDVTQALTAALHENKGLVHLTVDFRVDSGWTELLEAISMHPSLRFLRLEMWHSDTDLKKRCEVTKAVADMLSVNERVQVMSFHDKTFDKVDWDTYVAPRLECNFYREWLPSIQKIEEASTRAAVLARALAKFSSNPHLVLRLLNQNHDIVSSYLDTALDLNSVPS